VLFHCHGREYPVALRRLRKGSRPRIVARGASIELVLPAATSVAAAERLLEEKRGWLEARLAAPDLDLARRDTVWLALSPIPVIRLEARRPARLERGALVVGGSPGEALAAIDRWYRRTARATIEATVRREAEQLALTVARIAVRDQRTRWASCSTSGTLSFSWRLILAPQTVLNYVVVHELLHRRIKDHSSNFWRLLDACLPAWQREHSWLERYGHELLAYRPELASA
jgi:predicted metal-dependent hydrolase